MGGPKSSYMNIKVNGGKSGGRKGKNREYQPPITVKKSHKDQDKQYSNQKRDQIKNKEKIIEVEA